MLETILTTLRAEFSDVPDAEQVTRILIRMLLAAVLGGLLGYERESKGKAAGIRTHMLVAMGAAMFVLVPELDGMQVADMSRVIQGIVTGIGFLGAGAIVKRASEEDVQGLTTAAGIWMTAAIGVACGLGRETTAVLATLLALGVLALVPAVVDRRR
ncbi:MgtC/SapB family protein [Roseateles sp. DC23W]|uniref:Protein MgtC n=1 Tax=Pelomonas dachongensis TaxID=3299029 RepID=A0ABW7EW32_9BURK